MDPKLRLCLTYDTESMAVGLGDRPLDCKLTKGPSIAQIEPTSLPDDVRNDASVLHVIHAHPAHAHIPNKAHTRHRARPTVSVDGDELSQNH